MVKLGSTLYALQGRTVGHTVMRWNAHGPYSTMEWFFSSKLTNFLAEKYHKVSLFLLIYSEGVKIEKCSWTVPHYGIVFSSKLTKYLAEKYRKVSLF